MSTQYLVGPTRTYATIQAAIAAIPASIVGTGIHEVIVDSGDYSISSGIILTLSTTNSIDYVHLRAASGSEWLGLPNTLGVRITYVGSGSGAVLDVGNNCKLSNIVILDAGTGGSGVLGVQCSNGSVCENVFVKARVGFQNNSQGGCTLYKCVAVSDGGGSFPIGFNFANGTNTICNCGSLGYYLSYSGNSTSKVLNCWGIHRSGSGTADFQSFNSSTSAFNASTDATAPGTGSIINQTQTAFGFTNASVNDYHVSRSSVLRFSGTNLATLFTTDFDVSVITNRWPIGPDAFNGIVSGTYNVGPGEILIDWNAAVNEINSQTLTGDITFIQTGNITQSTNAFLNPCNYSGFTIRYTSSKVHNGDPNQAWSTTFSGSSNAFGFGQNISQNGGKHLIDNLYLIAAGSISGLIGFGSGSGSWYIHDNLFSQTNNIGGGSAVSVGNGCNLYIYNCKTWPAPGAFSGLALIIVTTGGVGILQIENCTAYLNFGPCYSVSNASFSSPATRFLKNCIAISLHQNGDQISSGIVTQSNNASSDSSASGSGSLTGVTSSQFKSIVQSSTDFLNLANTSSLNGAGITPAITGNDHGCRNNLRPHGGLTSIGADETSFEVYKPTSSSPWENKNVPHQRQLDAKNPQLTTLAPEPVPGHGKAPKGKEAQNPVLNKQYPEASPSFNFSNQTTNEAKSSNGVAKKGYVNGFVSVMAESGGYGKLSPTLGTGQMVYLISDGLVNAKTYVDRNNVRPTRAVNQRVGLPFEPHGNFVHELRSNDAIAIFQSHFQNRIGTTPASGTTYYEFTPFSGRIDLSGSSFGTGSYVKGTSQAFTVSVFKAVNGTGFHYKSGVCKSLKFNFDPRDSVQLESDYSFGTVSIVATNTGLPFGQYSTLPNFPGHKCSINFFGLPLTNFAFECNNNMVKSDPVGGTLCYYKFGLYDVTGEALVDIPPALFQYYATMLANTSFPVYGTMFNDDRDKIIFQMDNCRLDSFEYNLTENIVKIPFRAYESEDGSSPPVKFRVWTHNYSATTFEPN